MGVAGAAAWSPDGRYVAFEFHPNAYTQIYVAEVAGAPPRIVTTFPDFDNGGPNWSRDGQWIYFNSDRGGRFQLWKVRPEGGPPIQVTKNGGIFGIESSDGKFLYFAKFQEPGIWRMPLSGGEETRILDAPERWFNWSPADNGIYFLDGRSIQFFDFASHQEESYPDVKSRSVCWARTFSRSKVSPFRTGETFGSKHLPSEELPIACAIKHLKPISE